MESWKIALGALVKDTSLHGPNGKQKRIDVEISEGRGPEVMKLLNDNVLHTESWQVNYRWSYCAGRKDMIKIMNLTIDEAVKLRDIILGILREYSGYEKSLTNQASEGTSVGNGDTDNPVTTSDGGGVDVNTIIKFALIAVCAYLLISFIID